MRSGTYTPWQYLQAVSNTVGSVVTAETEFSDELLYFCPNTWV